MSKQESKANQISGQIFVGCILLGVGIGFLVDNIAAGSVTGVGVGFIAISFARLKIKD